MTRADYLERRDLLKQESYRISKKIANLTANYLQDSRFKVGDKVFIKHAKSGRLIQEYGFISKRGVNEMGFLTYRFKKPSKEGTIGCHNVTTGTILSIRRAKH
jgi:hypothetical protein